METIDWMKAEPIDVEREVRRRLGQNPMHVAQLHGGTIIAANNIVYTRDIANVLYDLLPKFAVLRPDLVHWVEQMEVGRGRLLTRGILEMSACEIARWDHLKEAPLALCRAFCQLPEGGK